MKKLILDVDTGIDDALAIVYALSQTEEIAHEKIDFRCGYWNR